MESVKVVASSKVARRLIKDGFPVVDIKPHKNDPKRTVFVFEDSNNLREYLELNKVEV